MNHKKPKRHGITLIELLVVIGIMMMLAAVVLPQLNFSSDSHKIREASRMVSTYLSAARNRAIETGRPCGVLFERTDRLHVDNDSDGTLDTPCASIQMVQIQEPAPYAGDDTDSRVTISGGTAIFVTISGGTAIPTPATVPIFPGDRVQFDYQGPWYPIESVTPGALPNTTESFTFTANPGVPVRPLDGKTLPFQIRRQPISSTSGQTLRSMVAPQQLPRGVAVDLTASGVGGEFFSDTNQNVAIMFDPNGSVYAVYGLPGSSKKVTPIYLLVGEEMQVPDGTNVLWYTDPEIPDNDEQPNWESPDSRWVVIAPSTGTATVEQNVPVAALPSTWNPVPVDPANPTLLEVQDAAEAIHHARGIASQGLGGGENR